MHIGIYYGLTETSNQLHGVFSSVGHLFPLNRSRYFNDDSFMALLIKLEINARIINMIKLYESNEGSLVDTS